MLSYLLKTLSRGLGLTITGSRSVLTHCSVSALQRLLPWHSLLFNTQCLSLSQLLKLNATNWLNQQSLVKWLKRQHLSLTVLEARKSEMKAIANLVSGESPLPGSETASSPCVLTWWKGLRSSWGSLLYGYRFHSWGLHPHDLISPRRPQH